MRQNIVYAFDHNYFLYGVTSIYSLLKNGCRSNEYQIFLLLDDSITVEDISLLEKLEDHFSNCYFVKYYISEKDFDSIDFTNAGFLNKATLYRLVLPSLLHQIDKCLYIDSDTLVRGDLSELYELDLQGYYLAGVWDCGMKELNYSLPELIPNMDSYVNAGIIMMNLDKLRRENIQEKMIDRLLSHDFRFYDQDVLNIECYGKIKLIPDCYNYFCYRKVQEETRIIHYLGYLGIRPWTNTKAFYADEWWSYAEFFQEFSSYQEARKAAEEWYRHGSLDEMIRLCDEWEKVYIWGAAAMGIRIKDALSINKGKKISAYIDGNSKYVGETVTGLKVLSPDEFVYDGNDKSLIIISAQRRFEEIKEILVNKGFREEQIFIYVKRPIGFYTVLDEKYRPDEYKELLKWDYGDRQL